MPPLTDGHASPTYSTSHLRAASACPGLYQLNCLLFKNFLLLSAPSSLFPFLLPPSSLVPRISVLGGHWDSLPLRLLASTSKMQSFIVLSSLAAGALAQTYSATYLPSNAPNQSEQGQAGTNKCGTGHSDTSMCQNAYCECCASLAW